MKIGRFTKRLSSLVLFVSLSALSSPSFSEEYSVGIGLGSLYNGIGVNIGISNEKSFRYISIGCLGFSANDEDDFSGMCGIGAGYIKNGFFNLSPEHTLGGMISVNYDEQNNRHETFAGLSYHYMASKNPGKGWGIGFTPGVIFRDSSGVPHLMLNLGYQY